jgi:hypothetical protein
MSTSFLMSWIAHLVYACLTRVSKRYIPPTGVTQIPIVEMLCPLEKAGLCLTCCAGIAGGRMPYAGGAGED